MASLHTVNVIEFEEDQIIELTSFADDKEGNDQAEALFKSLVEELDAANGFGTCNIDPDLMADSIENGIFNKGTRRIVIWHSTKTVSEPESEPEPKGGCHICGHDH